MIQLIKRLRKWNKGLTRVDKFSIILYSCVLAWTLTYFDNVFRFISSSEYIARGLDGFTVAHLTVLNTGITMAVLGYLMSYFMLKIVKMFRKVWN